MTKPLITLIDCNNSLYRYFHTQPPRIKSHARTESALCLINSVIRHEAGNYGFGVPEIVVPVFDTNGKNFRHDLDPNYKSHRKGMPDELKEQEPLAINALGALGLPVIVKEGFEADDALAMIANFFVDEGYQVVIETVDKDMHQLISDDIRLYNPISKKLIGVEETEKKFGVGPDQIAEYLAIMGDKEDGVIGIEGVGPKTAAKWLTTYGSIEELIKHSSDIKGKVGERLRAFGEGLLLNVQLTRLDGDKNKLNNDEIESLWHSQPDMHTYNELVKLYQFPKMGKSHAQKSSKEASVKSTPEPVIDEPDEPSQGMLF